MSHYMDNFLSKHLNGFRKGYNTQCCLLKMLGNGNQLLMKENRLVHFWQTYLWLWLSRDLLLAKLHAYVFSLSALKLIHNYLKNRKQRTKIDSTYRSWEEILFGIPQGSILKPLLFNIFLCDLFFSMNETDLDMPMTTHLMIQVIVLKMLLIYLKMIQ